MTYLDDVKDENAALREENARLQQRNAALLAGHDDEVDGLRAHVAALVKYARHYGCDAVNRDGAVMDFGMSPPCICGLDALLTTPDLAALLAREQARHRLIEKMAEYIAERDPQHPLLAALDAVEKP